MPFLHKEETTTNRQHHSSHALTIVKWNCSSEHSKKSAILVIAFVIGVSNYRHWGEQKRHGVLQGLKTIFFLPT